MGAVSGAMIPRLKIESIAIITPHYWALEGIHNVISRGMGLEGVINPTAVLLGMTVLFFAIGAWRFKYE
jgi:ABC-2 type transport system permease protein